MDPIGVLLASTVSNYLLAAVEGAIVRQPRRGPDFEIRQADGSRILIEVKTSPPRKDLLSRLAESIARIQQPGDRFILVTPQDPTSDELTALQSVFSRTSVPSTWVGIEKLPAELGTPSPGDFSASETLAKLQVSSLVGNIERYRQAPIGVGYRVPLPAEVAVELAPLTRQLSYGTLNTTSMSEEPPEKLLRIGQRTVGVTVVLSDLVNFSSLVTASRPEDLRDSMDRYYRLSRDAVFDHGGMLDKFIGDAVLAVFGYPLLGSRDAADAISLAQDLVSIGIEVLHGWLEELNAVIDTGTRVGIATGDLWPMNIGRSELEITLLGDTINLAARLEKNCEPDHLLIDNRTKTKATREDSSFVETLGLVQLLIPKSEAKGQQFPIRAWSTGTREETR